MAVYNLLPEGRSEDKAELRIQIYKQYAKTTK